MVNFGTCLRHFGRSRFTNQMKVYKFYKDPLLKFKRCLQHTKNGHVDDIAWFCTILPARMFTPKSWQENKHHSIHHLSPKNFICFLWTGKNSPRVQTRVTKPEKKTRWRNHPKKAVDHHSDPSNSGLLDIIMCPQKGHNKLQNCKCGKFCYGVSWAAAVVVGVFLVYRCIQVFVGGTFFCNPDFISEN